MKEEQNKIGGIKVEDFLFRYFFWFNLYMYRMFFLAGTCGSYLDNNRIQDYSGRAIGHITKKHFQTTIDGSGNYYLDYWILPAAGSKINVSSVTAKQQWDMLRVDDTMEIRYDQSNPHRNIPMYGGSPSLVMAFFMLVLGAVFILFGGSRFFNSFHKRKICT